MDWVRSDKGYCTGDGAGLSKLDADPGLISPNGDVVKLASLSFISGAVLGPVCDGFHSSHDVLHYTDPSMLTFPLVR